MIRCKGAPFSSRSMGGSDFLHSLSSTTLIVSELVELLRLVEMGPLAVLEMTSDDVDVAGDNGVNGGDEWALMTVEAIFTKMKRSHVVNE